MGNNDFQTGGTIYTHAHIPSEIETREPSGFVGVLRLLAAAIVGAFSGTVLGVLTVQFFF